MDYSRYLTLILLLVIGPDFPVFSQSADDVSYNLGIRPDIWYNSTDGIRLGGFLEGRDIFSDDGGRHRLDLGLWLATRWPDHPVSYHISIEEPIRSLSDYGSELYVRLASTRIDGYQDHTAGINKRWQKAFDVTEYWELSLSFSLEQRFDNSYVLYSNLWSEEWKHLFKLKIRHQHRNSAGLFQAESSVSVNSTNDTFGVVTLDVGQEANLIGQWRLHLRGFAGVAGNSAYSEYRFARSFLPAISTLESPLTRARGTLPPSWVQNGYLHRAGGANLRGYTRIDSNSFGDSALPDPLYNSIGSLTIEMDLPNPIQTYFNSNRVLKNMLSFRSYIFSDSGFPLGLTSSELTDIVSDAGLGVALSLNIPDDNDKPRGFVIRYEVPVWLSSPHMEKSWKIRHLIGIGAVITF